jgi:predicted RNase H-like nuclease
MATVLGVDGCPKGWCAVSLDTASNEFSAAHYDTFDDVLATRSRKIAIDMPIGLMDSPGGRDCDREARALLGWPRRNSVFSPPARATLAYCDNIESYRKACKVNEDVTERKISRQAFNIGPKIKEVDDAMTRQRERRVFEAHPEVSLAAMTGVPMKHRKSRRAGRDERWRPLSHVFRLGRSPEKPAELRGLCGIEDYIDALVCAWTAKRILEGKADPMPAKPPRDPSGLRMAIWRPRPLAHRVD